MRCMGIHCVLLSLTAVVSMAALAGCATPGPQCKVAAVMQVFPQSGTADSAMKPPGNQQQFQASIGNAIVQQGRGNCAVTALSALVHPTWISSDPTDVTISSADDSTNGLAICTGPTAGAVTLTATLSTGTTSLGAMPRRSRRRRS